MTLSRRHLLQGTAAVALAATVGAACTSDDAADDDGTSGNLAGVDLPVAFSPVLISTIGTESAPVECSDGRWRVLYELLLTNAKPATASIGRIDVVDASDPDRVISSIGPEELAVGLHRLSGASESSTSIPPDVSRLLYVELDFDGRNDVPDAVAHRFIGDGAANPGATEASAVDYLAAPFDLTTRSAAVIAAPLRGGRWLAVNGLDSTTGVHRGSVQSVGGRLYDAQRFAIDWMLLGDDDTLSSGDPTSTSSYHGFGAEVLAVADGSVVAVLDALDDQAPGTLPDPTDITIDTVDGNHVILEIGDGVYAFYAHLEKGSINVSEGDRVSVGDQIGTLGSSGNTSAPHLHLHLMTAPDPLGADGIPYVFEEFSLRGRVNDQAWGLAEELAGPWAIDDAVDEEMTKRLPLGLAVVAFPS